MSAATIVSVAAIANRGFLVCFDVDPLLELDDRLVGLDDVGAERAWTVVGIERDRTLADRRTGGMLVRGADEARPALGVVRIERR